METSFAHNATGRLKRGSQPYRKKNGTDIWDMDTYTDTYGPPNLDQKFGNYAN